jgi:ABC-type transport system involved in multi-copper enzyme maturation permease subunit
MTTRNFVLTIGILYLLVGALGFFPGLVAAPHAGAPNMTVDSGYGYLLGLFPVNVLYNVFHLAIGVLALGAYRSLSKSITVSRGLAILFGVLTVVGMIPMLNTSFGLIPLFGHNVWLHAVTATIAAYFGYAHAAEAVPVEWKASRAS